MEARRNRGLGANRSQSFHEIEKPPRTTAGDFIEPNKTQQRTKLNGRQVKELNENSQRTAYNETEPNKELNQTAQHGAHPVENFTRTHELNVDTTAVSALGVGPTPMR